MLGITLLDALLACDLFAYPLAYPLNCFLLWRCGRQSRWQVTHVSEQDQAAVRAMFASGFGPGQWLLLRTPLRLMRALPKTVRATHRQYGHTKYLGFLGDGQTVTNHQAIKWFLSNCWRELRRKLPGLRLRLVGRPPGSTSNLSGGQSCDPAGIIARAPCGWASGTPFAGKEAEAGIDELGFYEAEDLLTEALSWRVFVAPVHHATGIQTKLLVALELGIPIVSTSAAAIPFDLARTPNTTLLERLGLALDPKQATALRPPAIISDEVGGFIQGVHALYSQPSLWKAGMSSARLKFREMMATDTAASDLRTLLRAACTAPTAYPLLLLPVDEDEIEKLPPPSPPLGQGPLSGWKELRYVTAGAEEWRDHRSHAFCANRDRGDSALTGETARKRVAALIILAHGEEALPRRVIKLLHRVFWHICRHCALNCVEHPARASGYRSVSELTDIWMDGRWNAPPAALTSLPNGRFRLLRFWHSHSPPDETQLHGETHPFAHALSLPLPLLGCLEVSVAGISRASDDLSRAVERMGGVPAVWRRAFEHAGFDAAAIPALVLLAEQETQQALMRCESAVHVESLNGDESRR